VVVKAGAFDEAVRSGFRVPGPDDTRTIGVDLALPGTTDRTVLTRLDGTDVDGDENELPDPPRGARR
jgi:hypothetical protein